MKQTYKIYTRNQTGTTLYFLGQFNSIEEATVYAEKNYKWFSRNDLSCKIITD